MNRKNILEQLVPGYKDFQQHKNNHQLYRFVLGLVEKPLFEMILEQTRGNQIKAAKILGINRNTLHSKIKKLGISTKKWKP